LHAPARISQSPFTLFISSSLATTTNTTTTTDDDDGDDNDASIAIMGLSRNARIITLLIIDTAFFFLVRNSKQL
jgi:hypothetical protein